MTMRGTKPQIKARSLDSGSAIGLLVESSVATIRIHFLCVNAMLLFLCMMAGCVVFQSTESMTVQLDLIAFSCDALALGLNIALEVAKARVRSEKHILIMDFSGFMLSLSLLVCVALYGLNDSLRSFRSEGAMEHAAHVGNLDAMVLYAMFTMTANIVVISLFLYLKDVMLPRSPSGEKDSLNVQSAVVHACAGYVSSVAVLLTSIFLMYMVPRDVPIFEKAKQKVHIDVYGSVAVCACICASVVYISAEAVHTFGSIWSFDEAGAQKLASPVPTKRKSYGAIKSFAGCEPLAPISEGA